MNRFRISLIILLFQVIFGNVLSADDHKNEIVENKNNNSDNASPKYGALAIDRGNGIFYGWATDCSTLAEAEKNAIEECNKKGGKCTVVLSFSGTGCAVYRFISGNVGYGYGWGIARTKEVADIIAKRECAERSFGIPAPNIVWKCNDPHSNPLKIIYDAHDEVKRNLPKGIELDY